MRLRRFALRLLALGVALCAAMPGAQAMERGAWVQSFVDSQFQFRRATSNAPFLQMAWVDYIHYGDSALYHADGSRAGSYEQDSVSQGLIVPLLLDPRDMLLFGDWLSFTSLDGKDGAGDVDVLAIGLPLGWMRQASEHWQLAAFVAPLAHRATSHGEPWYWEGMGGVFALYTPEGRWSWIFGAYADVSKDDEFYVPYAGASFQIDARWTLSLVLPWPAVIYAPDPAWMLRAGVAPAGATWSVQQSGERVTLDQDAWNLGLAVEHRIWRNLWMAVEGGLSGFRGFGFVGSDWQAPNSGHGTSPYLRIGVNFRPPAMTAP